MLEPSDLGFDDKEHAACETFVDLGNCGLRQWVLFKLTLTSASGRMTPLNGEDYAGGFWLGEPLILLA